MSSGPHFRSSDEMRDQEEPLCTREPFLLNSDSSPRLLNTAPSYAFVGLAVMWLAVGLVNQILFTRRAPSNVTKSKSNHRATYQ